MDNTRSWGHNLEIVESLGAPLEELESLPVSIELNHFVGLGSIWCSEHVGLNRVVNDEINRTQWINLRWITSQSVHCVSHSSQVHDSWHSTILMGEKID